MAELLPKVSRERQRSSRASLELWLIIMFVVVLLLSGVGGWWLFATWTAQDVMRFIVQSILIAIGAMLPVSIYAFFMRTRHAVIWREFEQNLLRLGMKPGHYRERFDAVYGPGASDVDTAIIPFEGILMTLVLFVGWWLVFYPPPADQASSQPFIRFSQSLLAFGFLGTYTNTLRLFYRRFVTDDLKTKVLVTVVIRVLIMVTIVWTITQVEWLFDLLNKGDIGAVLIFFIGMYPDLGIVLIEGLVRRVVRTGYRTQYPLSRIQELTRLDSERLSEEGIDNIQHLATADIVNLLLKTRLPPERIVDWIDQALLQFHLLPTKNDAKKEAKQTSTSSDENKTVSSSSQEEANEPSGGESDMQEQINKLEQLRASVEELQGLDTQDPVHAFLATGIRTATDLLYCFDRLGTDRRAALRKAVGWMLPAKELDFLVAALREDPNIVHIRHWRENEHLVIAETTDRMLLRANELMEEAARAKVAGTQERAMDLYLQAADAYEKVKWEHNAAHVRLSAMMGHGRAMLALKKYQGASNDFNAVVDADPEGGLEARLERTRLLIASWDDPKIAYDAKGYQGEDLDVLLRHPAYQNAEVWRMYYRTLQGTIDARSMRESLTEALQAAGTNEEKAELLRLRARHLSPKDAELDYKHALDLVPGDPQTYQLLIDFYVEQGDSEAAARMLKAWIQHLQKVDVDHRSRWIGKAYDKLGTVYMNAGDYQAAAEAFDVARKMPFDLTSDFQPHLSDDRLIACYEKLQDHDKLVALFRETKAHTRAAAVLRRMGDFAGARRQLDKEAAYITSYDGDLDYLKNRQLEYHFELAVVEACTGHPEQATANLIRILELEYWKGEHDWGQAKDHLARQESAISRMESEVASCEGAGEWVRQSRKQWEQVCERLYQGDNEWASTGDLSAAIQLWQTQLERSRPVQATDPWHAFAVSQCEARLANASNLVASKLRRYIESVDRVDDHTVCVDLGNDWQSLQTHIESWLLVSGIELEAPILQFDRGQDRTYWQITFQSYYKGEDQVDQGYLAADHLIELLAPFAGDRTGGET